MKTNAILVNPETDGAMPVSCELTIVGDKIQFWCNGLKGWIIQIQLEDIIKTLEDNT